MNSLEDYIEVFTHLHTAKVKGYKAPHKAEIDGTLFQLLQNVDARAMLRIVLINEYLANQQMKSLPSIIQL
ncbi:MAG: hypothetical protein J6Q93_04885 [Prevotella sp.]|nr:hypothetical protein [Prevotella sp.]